MPLRINLPRAMLPLLTNRLLPDFLEAYPNVQLELCGDDNFIDIVEQGFDAGIGRTRIPWRSHRLAAYRLLPTPSGTYRRAIFQQWRPQRAWQLFLDK